jgi:hypothetical protein
MTKTSEQVATLPDGSPAYPPYEQDLVAWAAANAALLRAGRLAEIDVANIAEELEDMGKSERRALASHIRNLLMHLLKWRYQAGLRGASWRLAIDNARQEIRTIVEDSPSLVPRVAASVDKEYPSARRNAATETGFPQDRFPAVCPFETSQVLDEDFWPDAGVAP